MSVRLGISLLDLLPQTTGVALQVPDGIVEQIGVLTVLDHRATTSGDFFLHEGTLQSVADALDLNTTAWGLRIPGLTQGLPFRLALQRVAPAAGQEPAPLLWTLDIEIWDVEVQLPGLRAAQPVGGVGVTPLTLQPVGNTDATRAVWLVARGVIRVSGGGGATQVQVVDTPDPFDPGAPTGTVIRLTARPPHFLFGGSRFGMSLDQVVLDLSRGYTPAEIEARDHDEAWEGVAFREAAFYFPPDTPLLHSLSLDARDVIIGDPGGLQGELRVEFGEDFNDLYNTRLSLKLRQADGSETDLAETTPPPRGTALQFAVPMGPGDTTRRVRAIFEVGAGELIPGHTDLAAVGVWWKLPDGREGNDAATPWFDAPTSARLRYRLRLGDPSTAGNTARPASAVPADQTELVEVSASFPRQAGGASGVAPLVDATIDGAPFSNVLHLRGPRALLAGIQLAVRGGGHADWRLGAGSAPMMQRDSAGFTLPLLASGAGSTDLVVSDANGTRRIRIEVVGQGALAVGHQASAAAGSAGVVTVVGLGAATPSAVTDTFLARDFAQTGGRPAASVPASLTGSNVAVPAGADAEVEVPVPAGGADPLPVNPVVASTTPAVVQILYNWDEHVPLHLVYPYTGVQDPTQPVLHDAVALPLAGGDLNTRSAQLGANVVQELVAWRLALGPENGRKFYVVGRTDDLKYNDTEAGNNSYNLTLARGRMQAAVDSLVAAGVPLASIIARPEPEAFPGGVTPEGDVPARIPLVGRLALPAGHVAHPTGATLPVWNDRWTADGLGTAQHQLAKDFNARPPYRCAEIYAVDTGAPPVPPPPPGGDGVPVRMLVPGPDGAPPAGLVTTNAASPPTDYRVRLRVKWDSPTVVSLADAIPSEAEALIAWKSAQVDLPASASGTAPAIPPPTGPDFWEILLHWTYDSRTGETAAEGALSLPDGTLTWQSDALAGALAFGPAVTALLDPADAITDPAGQFVAAAAILAVGAAIGELINTGGGPESSVDIDKLAISYRWNGAPHAAATVDYTIELRVNVSVAGAGSLTGHLKLRYKGVGLRFDGKPGGGLAGVALTYDSLSVEVVDPGNWSLGGPLGNLIRIAASRMGNGSQWMEFDLEFALDLGVVRLEGATIRLGLEPFSVEFRGLAASIDIPGTLKGRGSVAIGDGGSFRALLALEVIPAKLSAYGSLAVDQDFVAIEVGVQLPVGIPLGGTGFGIFGFMGRFVANGTRNLDGLANTDPVQKQLDWYVRSPEQKYKRKSGQFAFGVGAVIGTLPDGGFTFNAEGSLTIGFPDISVVFGIDAHLITQRKSAATESGTDNASSFRILGMVLIDEDSIMVAVRASYEIPKVLKLEIPISAYFPLAGGDAWYIRIGTDNDASRPGSPVTITLLPDTLNVRAWAFVMVEERQLHHLGGTLVPLDLAQPLDFDGFSIGMGAGFDLKWEAGPFSLEISAFLLLGMGTKPLLFAGAAGIKGELDLVVISVGVDGVVNFHISPSLNYIHGHFCGHVDLFLFEVSGCVDIHFGDDANGPIPAPDSPVAGMELCDHLAAVKGRASHAAAEAVPVVWPDTVAVLRFAHYIEDALGGAADFDRKLPPSAALSPWNGSTELKYAFRLKSVELWKLTGGNPGNAGDWTLVHGPFDAAWWLPTFRKAVIEGGDQPGPSTEEGRELGLFSADPRAWSRWLGEGTQNVPGDPANTVDSVCDPAAPADPSCAYGKDRFFLAGALGGFKATPAVGAAIPSRFIVRAVLAGGLDAATLAALGADAGWNWVAGAVAPLHGAAVLHGNNVAAGWRFPSWRQTGHIVATAPVAFGLSKPLLQGELVLEVCADRQTAQPPQEAVCDTMPDKDTTLGGFTGKSGAKYEGGQMQALAIGGERALILGGGMMVGVAAGPVDAVAVDIQPTGQAVTLLAFAADGSQLGIAVSTAQGRQWLRIAAKGIARITLRGAKPVLFEVCWGAQGPAILQLVPLAALKLPLVTAYDVDGNAKVLDGVALDTAPAPASLVALPRCPKLVYALPKGKGWTRVEVAPWLRGDISLVALCGVTMEAAAAAAADGDFRIKLGGLLLGLADAAETDTPTHDVVLEPASIYEIRVGWQWQGFRPAHPGDEPAPPSAGGWTDGAAERFRFATAAFGLAAPPPPVQGSSLDVDPAQGGPGYDERSFDPRGLSRYLTRAYPGEQDPPHFLDDHVGFWFMVDHLEKLVEKYDRILQVKVLHTRPAPGSLHAAPLHVAGGGHVLDVTTSVSWSVDTLSWNAADFRLVEAAVAAPCIGKPPALGSSSVSVSADLEPHSEYDLLLNTAPQTVGAFAEVQVARSHFRTSRYRNPTGMLAALGFASPIAITLPTDAIATAPLAGTTLELGDAALDAALMTMGLDPWPLPAAPRTSAIWLRPASPGQPWRLAGVLVEADEPVWRAGMRTGAYGEAPPPPRLEVMSMTVSRTYEQTKVLRGFPGFGRPHTTTVTRHTALGTLLERVRNAAGTRSIFVPSAPIAMGGGRLYDLAIRFRENGSPGAQGSAPLLDRPLTVAQEGE